MPRAVLIHGAGGHAKVVAEVARSAGLLVRGFVDDAPDRAGSLHSGLPVLSWEEGRAAYARGEVCALVPGIGDNAARLAALERARAAGLEVIGAVHQHATVAASARLGAGTVVMARAVVNPDAVIGEAVVVNTGAVVEHDACIGDGVLLGPGSALGGAVTLGPRTLVGVGASVLPGRTVGADVRVGGGAVVTRDLADGVVVVGVPARPLSRRRDV